MHFNPRAPCGARRLDDLASVREKLFQSTRPLRGATLKSAVWDKDQAISIHAPLAGRDGYRGLSVRRLQYFNPRAPCGARRIVYCVQLEISPFQSTRPLRGATPSAPRVLFFRRISIHAPLAGRDALTTGASCAAMNFNPRAPCGARHNKDLTEGFLYRISIHAPLAGRDLGALASKSKVAISIHAPLAGRDSTAGYLILPASHFNPRAPCGARRGRYLFHPQCHCISIHAPLAGRDGGMPSVPVNLI